jgi:uncharacterized protein DUF3105
MRFVPILGSFVLLIALPLPRAVGATTTALQVTVDGTISAGTTPLPWPNDPNQKQDLRFQLRSTVKATSSDTQALPQLVGYFNATTTEDGFAVTSPGGGSTLIRWQGRWTNADGFLLQTDWSGAMTGVVSQNPPVIAIAGAAEVRGLSGRGRGVIVTGSWKGQLDTATGALHVVLDGSASGDLGPPPVVCGEYTDEGLAGEIQPLMLQTDGTPNRNHFFDGDPYPHPFPYSTNPPTSGPHNFAPLPEGIYDTPQDDEWLVHNLEHGHVLVLYQPTVAPAVVTRLKALVTLYDGDVVMAPRPANDVPIALASWGRMQKFPEYDEPTVQNFIDRNRGHGPECFH